MILFCQFGFFFDTKREMCFSFLSKLGAKSMLKNLKYLVPNGITAASMLLGFFSLIFASQGQFELSAWMITWGALLDKLDGFSARLLNASSEFGVQYDSFADFVVFGIAPAGLYYFLAKHYLQPQGMMVYWIELTTALYVVATSARLARFNISDPPGAKHYFYGIPTTLSGILLSTAFLTWVAFVDSKSETFQLYFQMIPYLQLTFAVAMVSSLRVPKVQMRKSKALNVFQLINVIGCYLFASLQMYPAYLLITALGYTLFGIIWCLFHPLTQEELGEVVLDTPASA